jgi:hypothetical protein
LEFAIEISAIAGKTDPLVVFFPSPSSEFAIDFVSAFGRNWQMSEGKSIEFCPV